MRTLRHPVTVCLSDTDPSNENNLRKKTVSVTLKREGDGFGFKLRGKWQASMTVPETCNTAPCYCTC